MSDFGIDFSIKGQWWIPTKSEEDPVEIFGILSYTKSEGIKVIIEGSFFNTSSILRARHYFTLPLLYGRTQDHQYITLFNLQCNEQGSNNWIYTEIVVEFALSCDQPCFGVDELGILKMNFSLNCFNSFLQDIMGRLQWKQPCDEEVSFTYRQPPPLEVLKNENLEVYFYFTYAFDGLSSAEDFNFRYTGFLNYHYSNPVTIKRAVINLHFYKDFFTFFSYRRVSFNKVNFYAKNENNEYVEFRFLCKERSVEVGEKTAPYDILLDYKEVDDVFSKMLETWLSNQEKIYSGLTLFMQTNYFKFPSPIQSFLNLVFALETLHNTYFFKDNQSFKIKLKELISKGNGLLDEYIYHIEDFCKRVKTQRNYLAHDHSKGSDVAIPDEYYPYFIHSLKMIFECTFLRLLKLDDKRIKIYLKRHYAYQRNKERVQVLRGELL